jgi:formate-dependent nitrite reductase membrane component NrfD
MDYDLMLVIGLVIVVLAIPTMLQAYTDGRTPRTAGIMVMIATVLIVVALTKNPQGYSWDEMPDVVVRVIGSYLG